MIKPVPRACRVTAPARLHLGFLDPGAALGRRFGGIGLALEGLATSVVAAPHDGVEISGAEPVRAAALVRRVLDHFALPREVRVNVEQAIPSHAGLGSGTQLALAIGSAVTQLFGARASAGEIGAALGRGRRSGVGLSLFEQGGLIVDGGRGTATVTPPVVSRLALPAPWRAILVFDRTTEGLSGGAEVQAFETLPPLAAHTAAHLCHLTLMRLLPAVAEGDFAQFAGSIGEIQAIVGDHFASVQAGRYASPRVAQAIAFLCAHAGLRGVGQSSWGPTAFAFTPDQGAAERALAALRAQPGPAADLDFMICAARNRGAESRAFDAAPPRQRVSG